MILDEIHMTCPEWLKLQTDYGEKTSKCEEILEYLIRPALPFYRICLSTTLSGQEMITEMLPPRSCNVHGWRVKDGLYAEAKVVAKIYDPDSPSEFVVALGAVKSDQSQDYTAFSDYVIAAPKPFNEDAIKGEAWLALCLVQDALINRPAMFTISKGRSRNNCIGETRKQSSSKKNVIKAYRIFSLTQEPEVYPEATSIRKMGCPCWGVIGHWRTYKTGKVVWIAPYEKGKHRGNHLLYQSKEYQLMKEERI